MIQGTVLQHKIFVTPAKAGVHHLTRKIKLRVMDSRLRGNDEALVGEVVA
jgi:hypothetical protein